MSVARCGLHLEDTAIDREHTEVVSAAAAIKDEHILLTGHLRAIKAIGDGRRRRLVDDTEHIETRDHARVLRGLALRIIEIRGHSDHRVLHLATEIRLRSRLHLLQNRRADLLGQKALRLTLVVDLNLRLLALALEHLERPVLHVALDRGVAETATEKTLCIEHSVRGVRGGEALCRIANQTLIVGKRDVRGCCAVSLVVCDNLNAVILPNTNT